MANTLHNMAMVRDDLGEHQEALQLYDRALKIKEATPENEWQPGDYGTLRMAERGSQQFYSLQEGEIWNGRIAQIAILAYVVQEAITKVPTINTIPFF